MQATESLARGPLTSPDARELETSNHLLGDRAALDAAWERKGYWFFRDVLDHGAVARLRAVYMQLLGEYGVADPADPQARHTGASLEGFPFRMDPLSKRKAWQPFVREPAIHAFFRRLLEDEPFWIPTVEYRATPPAADRARSRLDFVHQDGFYNKGIPFRICWIPLAEIDDQVGGLILGEGLHRGPILHDTKQPPLYPIPDGAVPAGRWRRATYRPGDVLLMDLNTPHTGLANHSDRFRLSMDIRVMGANENPPMVGRLIAVEPQMVVLEGDDGRGGRFIIDEATYCRGLDGKQVPLADVGKHFHVGDEVILAARDGRATIMRPIH
ncbi:phytanoyl-CoA dioxygenase [Variovorax sp. LjRoot290]|uniref:phytanoyl-CoA dioxygenase family protein n=1 Tax=Variovorax sp. LjRoot290 TaxID=3342316 RepID=UPI003ED03534